MSLASLPGKIAMRDSHAVVVMAEGDRCHAVCIAANILSIADAETPEGLVECLALFERIANRKLEDGQIAYDGRVWITASDLVGCPPSQ
jgi:hypothetical protein